MIKIYGSIRKDFQAVADTNVMVSFGIDVVLFLLGGKGLSATLLLDWNVYYETDAGEQVVADNGGIQCRNGRVTIVLERRPLVRSTWMNGWMEQNARTTGAHSGKTASKKTWDGISSAGTE